MSKVAPLYIYIYQTVPHLQKGTANPAGSVTVMAAAVNIVVPTDEECGKGVNKRERERQRDFKKKHYVTIQKKKTIKNANKSSRQHRERATRILL